MRAVSIIIRFVQFLAIVPIGLGISNAASFFELLNGLAEGQPWDFAEFAKRLAAFSSPTGLGLALLLGLELLLRHGQVAHARALQFPEQPWLWNPMWAQRRIRLSNRTPILICLASLSFFAFVVVPVGLWMKSQMRDAPIYLFLGVLGVFILAIMRMTWLNRRWGRSELEIHTLPGVIGGPFRGTAVVGERLPEGTSVRVTLNCIRTRTYRMRPSLETRSVTDTIWQDQKILVTALSMTRPNGVAIPCSFAIPFSCEPTTLDTIGFSELPDPDEHVSIRWQLSIGMKDPLDVRAVSFDIPVFRTEQSSATYQEDRSIDAPYVESVDVDAIVESLPLQREYSATGERLRFTLMRKRDFLILLVVALAITAGDWAILYYVSMPGALFAAFLPVVLTLACIKTLVEAVTWNADIEITPAATIFTVGYRWSRRRFEFPRGKWPRLELREEMRRQTGSTYAVRMVPAEGPPYDLVKRLDGKQTATAVRDWLVKVLGRA